MRGDICAEVAAADDNRTIASWADTEIKECLAGSLYGGLGDRRLVCEKAQRFFSIGTVMHDVITRGEGEVKRASNVNGTGEMGTSGRR